ncbi:hypothetical protein IFR05_003113 [Cadophora sp. M221]|nr:hypothetical protein IFR05_003113 [Cadophora sp. M221]
MPDNTSSKANSCKEQTSATISSAVARKPEEDTRENGKDKGVDTLDITGWTSDDY